LQQIQKQTGLMQERTIIDGQQRLTTLQLLLDALHAELSAANATAPAARLEPLVANGGPFCTKPEDRFKVWPTNRDRAAFNAVMGATPPVDYEAVGHAGERMVEAHRFFSEQARDWLVSKGGVEVQTRAAAIERVVRELLQMVVIGLAVDENAQEIFETLNARGAQLTAADLIKNFVFQRLLEANAHVESVYEGKWREFETAFWEAEIGVGRLRYPRSSLFLNHWLVARTGKEVVAREVFDRFKRYATHESNVTMLELTDQIHRASGVYRQFITAAETHAGPIDRLGLFGYRTGVLESEVIKPLVLCLLDPEQPRIPDVQFTKALDVLESWLVRRMLVRATTKNYNQVVSEIVALLRGPDRLQAGETIERFLSGQSSGSRYWPDDDELREELAALLAYKRLGRGRLRMVLEAIEDYKRGWREGRTGLGDERVARDKYAIEHVMPRKWTTHWPPSEGADSDADRDRLIHTFGNLTLLTERLNSKVSNGPWLGERGKRAGLNDHDVFFLNRELVNDTPEAWTDNAIRQRTRALAEIIVKIWPVPAGHKSEFSRDKAAPRRHHVGLEDLISAGFLATGAPVFERLKKSTDPVGVVLADGRIEIHGETFANPKQAATSLRGRPTNGWWYLLVQVSPRRSLRDVWREYVASLSVDAEEDVDEDGEDDEG